MEEDHKITVFATPTCPYCLMVKKYLDDKEVEYKNVDVSDDRKAAQEMFEKSQQMGVPQIWIGDTVIIGFDPGKIDKTLRVK